MLSMAKWLGCWSCNPKAQKNGRSLDNAQSRYDNLSGQNFRLAAILTGHVHGFQINN